jgi:ATP-dependent RNA/DNA helicase IGHMBP2
VLAGDPEQLPPTVLGDPALASTFFARLRDRFGEEVTSMLVVQHRMNDTLVAYPSTSMYGGKLVSAEANRLRVLADVGVRDDASRDVPFIFLDTSGRGYDEAREAEDKSVRNPEQAERVAKEARRLLERGLAPTELAVIAAYDAQVRLLRTLLADVRALGVEVGTVDGFQGREKDAVIVDTVRSNDKNEIGFLADVRRMNVAITRARRFLLVVGDAGLLAKHPYYTALVAHAETTGAYKSAWEDDADLPL